MFCIPVSNIHSITIPFCLFIASSPGGQNDLTMMKFLDMRIRYFRIWMYCTTCAQVAISILRGDGWKRAVHPNKRSLDAYFFGQQEPNQKEANYASQSKGNFPVLSSDPSLDFLRCCEKHTWHPSTVCLEIIAPPFSIVSWLSRQPRSG